MKRLMKLLKNELHRYKHKVVVVFLQLDYVGEEKE